VSCAETVDVIRWAKQRDINVTAEVAPHHLMLTTTEVLGYDPTYKVNPPLRPNEHVEAVQEALADGTIDAVATDHAPHARHDKEHAFAEAAFGMLGLETALAVVMETMINSGVLSWPELAKRMSIRPAHIARLADQGRPLAEGEPANVVLVDPAARAVVDRAVSASLSRNNPWHGRELPDAVVATIWAGQVTYQKGQ
jgi:dihydroorotase